jgi:hypothetical protein
MKVLEYPLSGGLNIDSADGTITYIPSLGFVGVDSFNVEICAVNRSCRVERIIVTIKDARIEADNASPNLLYLLSLLALVPIVVLAVVCYKRIGDTAKPKIESTQSDLVGVDMHGLNDDEPREPISPTFPMSAVAQKIDGKQDSVPRPQQSDPLAVPPLVSATARLVADDGRDYKDQCRLEPSGKRLNPSEPLANALWVHQEEVDEVEA